MKRVWFATVLVFMMSAAQVFAWDENFEFEHETSSASDQENINSSGRVSADALLSPSTTVVTMDGELSTTPVKSVSFEAICADNVTTYNLPLSYGFPVSFTGNKELLNFKLVIPYTRRDRGTVSDSGLGDISLTTNYLIRFSKLLLDSKLIVKSATGEFKDADVPLGTGSTDAGLYLNANWFLDKLILRGGVGYSYNGTYEKSDIEVAYGDEYLLSAGLDYRFRDTIKAGGLFVYKFREEDDWNIYGGHSYKAGVNSLDFIPSVTYLYKRFNVELIATATLPVTESWNTDKGIEPYDDPDRSASFHVTASRPF